MERVRRWLEARRVRRLLGRVDTLLYSVLIFECDQLLTMMRSLKS